MDRTDTDTPTGRFLAEAGRRHGVASADMAHAAGLRDDALRSLARRGIVDRVAPTLYVVRGAPPSWLRDVTAATLLSDQALAARRTAIALHQLRGRPRGGAPHIVIPHDTSLSTGDLEVVVHRSRTLESQDRTTVGGIPTCTVERALVDEGSVDLRNWTDLVVDAVRHHSVTIDSVLAQLARSGRLRNRRIMASRLSALDPAVGRTRASSEVRFLDLVLDTGLPRPIVNYELLDVDGRIIDEIDLAWPQWRIGWELDSRAWHTAPSQMARDHMKDLRLAERGWEIFRVAYELIVANPSWVARRVVRSVQRAAARHGEQLQVG